MEYRGFEIKIKEDEDPLDPNELSDNVILVAEHRQFTVRTKRFNAKTIYEFLYDENNQDIRKDENKKPVYQEYYLFNLYAYIHSGVSLSLERIGQYADRFDSSHVGYILVHKSTSDDYDEITKVANQTVNEWNQYLDGSVWMFETKFDCCGGYYGTQGYKDAITDAKLGIDTFCNNTNEDLKLIHFQKLKAQIRHRVPFQYRSAFPALF